MSFRLNKGQGLLREAWNPLKLPSMQLYLNSANIILDGSGTSSWLDLSAYTRNFFQNTPGNRPTYNPVGLNGTPCLVFDGVNDRLDCFNVTGLLNGVAKATFVLVFEKPVTNNQGVALFISNTDNSSNTKASLYQGNGNQFAFFGRRLDSDASQNIAVSNLFSTNTSFIQIHSIDYDLGIIKTRVNGVEVDSRNFQSPGVTTSENPLACTIGQGTSSQFFRGSISDILIFYSTNLVDILRLEGFLARERNMLASLQEVHPYKYVKP